MPITYPVLEIDKLPGAENRVELIIPEGPPAPPHLVIPPPLNLEPFGPNPWAGGGQSTVNVPAFGTKASVQGGISPIWLLLLGAALLS